VSVMLGLSRTRAEHHKNMSGHPAHRSSHITINMKTQGIPLGKLPKGKSNSQRSLADDGTTVAGDTVVTKQPTHLQMFSELCDWIKEESPWSDKAEGNQHSESGCAAAIEEERDGKEDSNGTAETRSGKQE